MRKNSRFSIILISIFVFCGCEALFFHPDTTLRYHPAICEAAPVNALFKSYDNTTLHGWYIKSKTPAKGTVFFLHGNAQNISLHIYSLLWLTEHGYNIFTFDYRGYGISEGKPDIQGIVDDSLAAFDFLVSGEIPDVGNVIVIGQSMGGAAAVNLVARTEHQDRISALILDSAFASWREIYRQKAGEMVVTWPFQYPISWFINDSYAPQKFISQIPSHIRILIIHNTGDRVVPYAHALKLYESAEKRADLWTTEYEGHVTAANYQEFRGKLLVYLEEIQNN